MKIAVYGSAAEDMDPAVVLKARELGRLIAQRGHTLLTGACQGIPQQAVLGAHEAGGIALGYSPSTDAGAHELDGQPLEGFKEIIWLAGSLAEKRPLTTRYKIRNMFCVEACDACVFISGRIGTLNEFTLAYDFGKTIGVLKGSGGMTDIVDVIVEKCRKEPVPFIIASEDVTEILDGLEAAWKARQA